jgi:Domain of unknown function (DUF1905)/Bacteriocin-protection, YdeI or OmpD-Associated
MPNSVVHFTEIIKKMPPNPAGSWYYVDFPHDAFEAFGKRGFVRVKGFVNEVPFNGSLFPKGGGVHFLLINQKFQKQINVGFGDEIRVSIEEDFEVKIIEMPAELQEALDFDEEMAELFNKLSASNQKNYKIWINSGKQIETRIKRVITVFERLRKTYKTR